MDLARLLDRWRELGILFRDGGQMIHVAVEARNQELTACPAGDRVRAIGARKLHAQLSACAGG